MTHVESKGGLASTQFGFRKGRSTCDAIKTARDFTKEYTSEDGYCIEVLYR